MEAISTSGGRGLAVATGASSGIGFEQRKMAEPGTGTEG
jgi:hypothetical protein